MPYRIPILALFLLAAWLPPAVPSAADPAEEADLLKAAFVYNFAKYVHWPHNPEALDLCLVGEDGVFSSLHRLQGESVRGTPVAIRPLDTGADTADCDLLFVGESEKNQLEHHLDPLDGRPILTISDIPRFAERGGVISLFWENKKIRFAVNLQAARAAGLRISSRLLNLARIVDGTTDTDARNER